MSDGLQSYKGKGNNAKKTYYKLQPYLPNGKRISIRLGALSQKAARETVDHVRHLIEAKKHGVSVRESTQSWLRTANPELIRRLCKYGLAAEMSDPTIEEWFKSSRQALSQKTESTTQRKYRDAEKYLTEYFGAQAKLKDIGNSATIAMDNYALMKATGFLDASKTDSDDFWEVRNDLRLESGANSGADSTGLGESEEDDTKKASENKRIPTLQWALRDLNPRPSRCKRDALAN